MIRDVEPRDAPRVDGARPAIVCGVVGLVGLVAWLVALRIDPDRAMRAWLTAWMFGLSIALGALCMIMIAYVSGARWFVVVRRVAETMAISLPMLALGLLPLLLEMRRLYPWTRPPDTLAPPMRETVAKIAGWLDPTFFVWRSLLYFAVWIALALALWTWSVRMDAHAPDEPSRAPPERPVRLSALGLVLFGFTITFAAFDWLMSMSPGWHSTIFGVYYFAGAMLAALSAMVLVTRALQSAGLLGGLVAEAHYYALGRLMLVFVILWAYMAYSQGFLIWIGDIPGEVSWYLARWNHGWAWLFGLLVVGQFFLPFLLLLNYAIKRKARPLSWVAAWILFLHWVDVYWLVGPSEGARAPAPGWAQLPALAAVLGLGAAFAAWRLSGRAAAPHGDPQYRASLGYESP